MGIGLEFAVIDAVCSVGVGAGTGNVGAGVGTGMVTVGLGKGDPPCIAVLYVKGRGSSLCGIWEICLVPGGGGHSF